MQVTTADLAVVLGITDRRIQQLADSGVFRRLSHGEWDLADAVQSYVRHRLQSETKKRAQKKGNAEEKLKSAKAEREELKLAVERRELIPTAAAIAIVDELVGTLRAGFSGLPARVTRDLALRGPIEEEIDRVLAGAADQFEQRAAALRSGGDADSAAGEAVA